MSEYIVLLSGLSYQCGIIGLVEYEERIEVAAWLSDAENRLQDPRGELASKDRGVQNSRSEIVDCHTVSGPMASESIDELLSICVLNKWVFSVGDPDCYPSVPHGHLHKKKKWPKLNPYVGREFSGMHVEDTKAHLTRSEMKQLWNNKDFVEHCRKQVYWYSGFAPSYAFPNAHRGKHRFPRWPK